MKVDITSDFRRGAEYGIIMGILFILLFFSTMYLSNKSVAEFIPTVLMLCVPITLYVILKKCYVIDEYETPFFGLWLTGVISFVCGSIILAVVVLIHLSFIDPDLLLNWLTQAADIYKSLDDTAAQQMGEQIDSILKDGGIPSPSDMALQIVTTSNSIGMLLSLISSALIKLLVKKKYKTN